MILRSTLALLYSRLVSMLKKDMEKGCKEWYNQNHRMKKRFLLKEDDF